jgi:hypothetical protein
VTDVVGILAFPLGETLRDRRRGPLGRAYRRALYEKANPRSRAYMEALFAERYPHGRLAGSPGEAHAGEVVLLYPDAIGLGWAPIERGLPADVTARVLNGRRREFTLDRRARRALRVRRALERSLAGETLALAAILVASPFLVAVDALRGRR